MKFYRALYYEAKLSFEFILQLFLDTSGILRDDSRNELRINPKYFFIRFKERTLNNIYLKQYLLVFILGFFAWNNAFAQIDPPKLNCVRNVNNDQDVILEYSLALVSCGPISNYEVYLSQNGRQGPYTLQTTITDLATTEVTLIGAGQGGGPIFNEYYFFMRTNAACPGLSSISSDTLDNIKPKKPVDIENVSVLPNGDIELSWTGGNDPELGGYRIYVDNTATVLNEITGSNISSYVDMTTSSIDGPHTYYIRSLDICESGDGSAIESPIIAGTGFFPHTTIFLEITASNACDRSMGIQWTAYNNSPDDVLNYEIFTAVNGSAEVTDQIVDKNTLSATIDGLIDKSNITIRVAANLTNGPRAFSNQLNEIVDVTAAPTGGYIRTATVENGMLTVEFIEDTSGTVVDQDLLSSLNGSNFTNPGAIKIAQNPPKYEDRNGNPNETSYYYQVSRRDQCDAIHKTGAARTVFAQNRQITDETIEIYWNEFEIEFGTVTGYTVERFKNGNSDQTFSVSSTSFVDDGILNQDSLFQFCYIIHAEYDLAAPGFPAESLRSSSNETCFQLKPSVFVPSIFNPTSSIGENRRIRPFIKFGSSEGYSYTVFNRWGEIVYQTNNIDDDGWSGDNAPMESYVYHVKFQAQDGEAVEQSGAFVLMR